MPNRFLPVQGTNIPGIVSQINRSLAMLDKEVKSKQFKNANTGETVIIGDTGNGTLGTLIMNGDVPVMMDGKYRDNPARYGKIFYDSNGIPISLDGQAPDDGRIGKWVVKPGQNVITLLGG